MSKTYRMVDAMKTAWKYFTETKKMKPVVAAGIMGNIYGESTWNIHNTNGSHTGLCQWDNQDRWPRFLSQKRNPNRLMDQLEYLMWELETIYINEKPSWTEVSNAATVEAATKLFHDCFERSENWGGSGAARILRANEAYQHFVNCVQLNSSDYTNITVEDYDETSITEVDPQLLSNTGSTAVSGTGSSSGASLKFIVDVPTPGKHKTYRVEKVVHSKTPCVPIYPDIISVYNQIPDWAMKDFVGEENAKVDPVEGGVNKYRKITSKMKPQSGTSTAVVSPTEGPNSSSSGTNEDSKNTKKDEKKEELKKDQENSNIDPITGDVDLSNIGAAIGNAWEDIKKGLPKKIKEWNENAKKKKQKDTRKPHSPKTGFKSASFIDESRIPKIGDSLEIPEPVPINPGASNPLHKKGKYKALEIDWPTTTIPISKEKAKEKAEEKSPDKPSITASDVPQSAYDIEHNDHGCFNVVLPLGAVAKYGGENAKEALKYVQTLAQRQIRFDPREHSNAIKAPFPGKIQNNNDPFPVDMRIRDLETHFPRILINDIPKITEFEEATAKELVRLGADTEKRVVQIENHLATTMRYLWRLASIVQINDVYYGGNSMFEKYHSIRMLDDYLINDGFQTQLDQYLTSTKVEPIIGQTYEFLNQVGANLSLVLDDNQLSYSNMDHYVRLNDITKYQKPLKMATIHEAASLTKDKEDMVYNDMWGDGFVMNWTLVPVEEQFPMVNWRQSIIDDGAALMNTAPLYGSASGTGGAMAGEYQNNIFYKTAVEIMGSQNKDVQRMLSTANTKVKEIEPLAEALAKDKDTFTKVQTQIKSSGLHHDFSSVVIAVIMCIKKDVKDFDSVIKALKEITDKLKNESLITNPLLVALAYFEGAEYVIGDKPTKDPSDKRADHEELKTRLDFVYKTKEGGGSSSDKDKENKEDKDKDKKESNSSGNKVYFNLSIGEEAQWTLSQFMEPYSINAHKKRQDPVSIDNKIQSLVTLCICYKELSKKFMSTEFDNEHWGFFIKQELIDRMYLYGFPGEIRVSKKTGQSYKHQGFDIDISGTEEETSQESVEVLSPCDAMVLDSTSNYGIVRLKALNGTNYEIRFLHLRERFVNAGDKVTRGQRLGLVGGFGEGGAIEYARHIHAELWPEGYKDGNGIYTSIGDCYPGLFKSFCDKGIQIKVREYGQGDALYFKNFRGS